MVLRCMEFTMFTIRQEMHFKQVGCFFFEGAIEYKV